MAVNLNDGFSRDELKEWTVAQLYRSFLREAFLEIIVNKLWNTSPRRKEKLTFDGVSLPFPENVHSWLKVSEYLPDNAFLFAIFYHLCFGFPTWPQGVVGHPEGTFKMATELPK